MKTRAAILREVPGEWIIEELELDEPKENEVLVEMVASGLCHSDDHAATGDMGFAHFPIIGGHEGAGIVRQVGPGVTDFEPGDHIITAFIPSCGECKYCARGQGNLCNLGAQLLAGPGLDGTYRIRTQQGEDTMRVSLLGTFSEYQVFNRSQVIKVRKDVPLDVVCLVGCGVQTGFGSAVNAADVRPGDVVVVVGTGGVGMNAVQGAAIAGATHVVAIDPVEKKREWALDFGATDAFESLAAAAERLAHLTNGQGADSVILTPGVLHNDLLGEAYQATGKAGTLVVTALGPDSEEAVVPGFNAFMHALFQKRIQGALYGMQSPVVAIPNLIEMYATGKLKLDELVTKTYTLDELNDAVADMRAGKNIRGVVKFANS